jgi:hypothetical protein
MRRFSPFHSTWALGLSLALVFVWEVGLAYGAPSKKGASAVEPAKIAVLDLIEFADNSPKPEIGNVLRTALPQSAWSVLPRDTLAKKLREYGQNPDQACNTTQCAFDAGNILQVEYVLYGTCSMFGKVDALTLKLMHIPTAQIVWVRAFESPAATGMVREQNLRAAFTREVSNLRPSKLDISKSSQKKSLAVIDLSDNPQIAKVFFERVCTRIYGVRHYDLMAPSELAELLNALEINKYSVVPSLENMVGLGQKLGVGYLLYSRLYRDGKNHVYRLAFYDVSAKKLVLELPPQPSEDDAKLLDYERVFFNTLAQRDKQDAPAPAIAKQESKSSNKALWIAAGVLGVGGGLAALWFESWNGGGDGTVEKPPEDIFGSPKGPPPDFEK